MVSSTVFIKYCSTVINILKNMDFLKFAKFGPFTF